jgi:GNAT superfamily N-acetyltransferase
MIIGEAHGEFEKGKYFRLIKINVIEKNLGYGTKMIDRLLTEARANKCVHFVFVGVDITNKDAIRLYCRYGATPQLPLKSKNDYVFLL